MAAAPLGEVLPLVAALLLGVLLGVLLAVLLLSAAALLLGEVLLLGVLLSDAALLLWLAALSSDNLASLVEVLTSLSAGELAAVVITALLAALAGELLISPLVRLESDFALSSTA